jgi:hypothetical protein
LTRSIGATAVFETAAAVPPESKSIMNFTASEEPPFFAGAFVEPPSAMFKEIYEFTLKKKKLKKKLNVKITQT